MPFRHSSFLVCALAPLVLAAAAAHAATPVLATARSIAGGDATTRVDPVEQTLTLASGGIYNLTLADLKQPAAFAEVTLAVTSGTTVIGSTVVSGGAAAQVAQINAPAGSYVVHVIGALASGEVFGTANVALTDSAGAPVNGFAGPGGTNVANFTAVLSLPPAAVPPNARVIDVTIPINPASSQDTYELDLKDLQFPAALGTLVVNLADPNGNLVPGSALSAAGGTQSVTFVVCATSCPASGTSPPGNYHLVGGAQAASGSAGGLFNIHAFSTTTQADVLKSQAESLGQVAPVGAASVTSGSSYDLAFSDLGFPKPLTQGVAIAVQAGSIVASTAGAPPPSFTAVSADCPLFALAVPDMTAASGAYEVTLAAQGGAPVVSSVQATSNGTNGTAAYTYPVTANGGGYTLSLADFQFPGAFSSLSLAAAQNGALLGAPVSLTSPAPAKINPKAGQIFILAAATPGNSGKGVFGLELTPAAGGTPFTQTQGVGAAFGSTTASIATAGSYNVTLSDLVFPGNFTELAAVVTQGATRVGSIIGGGTFAFTAKPGDYIVSVLGTPAPVLATSAQTAGTYGIEVVATPPAPTVTFTASASQVPSGGTVTLTWSSQNATGCSATVGWSAALTTSGTQESPPITSTTTFVLTCVGAGGSASQSVAVSVDPPSPKGGGGASDGLTLLLLALSMMQRVARGSGRNEVVMYDS